MYVRVHGAALRMCLVRPPGCRLSGTYPCVATAMVLVVVMAMVLIVGMVLVMGMVMAPVMVMATVIMRSHAGLIIRH